MESLSLKRIETILKKNSKNILFITLWAVIIGVVYSSMVFKPLYKSTTRLLIKNQPQTTFVSELTTVDPMSAVVRNANPALTQIELIRSQNLAKRVWTEIKAVHGLPGDETQGVKMISKSISVENPVGTDILDISVKWADPKIARDIANTYASMFVAMNRDMAKESIMQNKVSIDRELSEAQMNLDNVRNQIRLYRQQNATIDIVEEARVATEKLNTLQERLSEINASSSGLLATSKQLSKTLGINRKKVLDGVALGSNSIYMDMEKQVGLLKEEYDGLAQKYTPEHPAMKVLEGRINSLKGTITKEISQTIGRKDFENGIVVSDPVRTGLIDQLSKNEADYRGLLAQANVVKSSINETENRKHQIAAKQMVLADLLQKETNWATFVDSLKAKQIEAKIKEAEIDSGVQVVDTPVIPSFASFPSRWQMVVMFAILGLFAGVAGVFAAYLLKGVYDSPQEIEESLGLPVLGVVPWLEKDAYNNSNSQISMDNLMSYYSISYQHIATNLKLKSMASSAKMFVFASTAFSKTKSTILANLAYFLAKCGRNVLIIDADFRTPGIHKEFGISSSVDSLSNLLKSLKGQNYNEVLDWVKISNYINKVPSCNNLHIIPNKANQADPYEVLHMPEFSALLNRLKAHYDYVFVDAPPILAVPDGLITASYTDGVLLSVGLDCPRKAVNQAKRILDENKIPVIGIIAREIQIKEAVTANGYIKQVISGMIYEEEEELRSQEA